MRNIERRIIDFALLAALVAAFALAAPAAAQEPWQTETGTSCFERWVDDTTRRMNVYSGDAEYNSRKPWSINRFGIFVGTGIQSNYEPDTWVQFGANRFQWMWGQYTSEEQYPVWRNANFNRAGLVGLRWFVRDCMGSAGSAGGGSTTGGTTAGTGTVSGGSCTASCGMTLDTNAACPSSFSAHSGSTLMLICYCAPDQLTGSVWGTGAYTADSRLCAAARHAGAVDASGGMIAVRGAPGRDSYQGTAANSITSNNYGKYTWSIVFPGSAPSTAAVTSSSAAACPRTMTEHRGTSTAITCHCASDAQTGNVWGSQIYTDDSAVCAAARHAGVVGTAGGAVTVIAAPGRSAYIGSTRNGITTNDYGEWHGSFRFSR